MNRHRLPDAARWQRIEAAFLAALETGATGTAAILDEHCGEDALLRREVEDLLEASRDADVHLGRLARRVGLSVTALPAEGALAGRQVGAYRLLEEIGRGGMGAVYRAERADREFEKEVAIKLLPLGLGTAASLERFVAEKRILARLDHPGIARLIDGGVTDDGTPYFVMEYVDGETITSYCERHDLDVAARIRLFQQVCHAVDFAHRNLVVHRDLKPSNILIAEDGAVKLLDFGIAKVLDDSAPDASPALTQIAGRVLTPAYASPEQVRGDTITTSSDVYALGVLLYELLAGGLPCDVRGLSASELERVVCEVVPERPSSFVRKRAEAHAAEPRRRAAFPARARRLRGDLDAIIMTALNKEPGRRYGSALALADDLERYVGRLPVAARPDSRAYRFRKMLARRPGTVAATAVVVLMLVAFGVVLVAHAERLETERNLARLEAQRADAEHDRATTERGRAEAAAVRALTARDLAESAQVEAEMQASLAESERARAELEAESKSRVTEFLVGLFDMSDYRLPGHDSLTARTLVTRGAERVTNELHDEPLTSAELLTAIGRIHSSLGLHEDARALLGESLALQRRHGVDRHRLAGVLVALGTTLNAERAYAESALLFDEAIEIHRSTPGDPLVLADALSGLASVHHLHRGESEQAETLIREALALRMQEDGAGHPAYLALRIQLAGTVRAQGRDGEAEAIYREVLKDHGGDLLPIARSRLQNDLAFLLKSRGAYDEAELLYGASLATTREIHGDRHRNTHVVLSNLKAVLEDQGKFDEVERLASEALETNRTLFPADHWRLGDSASSLGRFYARRGRLAEAASLFREAKDIYHRGIGPDHPWTGIERARLADVLITLDRYDEAAEILRRATDHLPAHRSEQAIQAHQAVFAALVRFHEATDSPVDAEHYRSLIADLRAGD